MPIRNINLFYNLYNGNQSDAPQNKEHQSQKVNKMSERKILSTIIVTIVLLNGVLGCTTPPPVNLKNETIISAPTSIEANPEPLSISTLTLEPTTIPVITETPQNAPQSEDIGLTRDEDAKLKPLQPSQLKIELTTNAVVLKWLGTGSDIIQFYLVYRRILDNENWQELNKVEVIEGNRGAYEFIDKGTEQGYTYIYGVKAIDVYGNESVMSESDAIVIQ